MRRVVLLIVGSTVLIPGIGAANDFSPRVRDYLLTLRARVEVTRAAKKHFRSVNGVPEDRVKLDVSLRDVNRFRFRGERLKGGVVFRVRAVHKGKTYEQFFQRDVRGTRTVVPVSHNPKRGTFFGRNRYPGPKKTWTQVGKRR